MRVFHKATGRDAAWRKSRNTTDEGYFVTPVGENEKRDAKWFSNLEDLAYFLIKNPQWKVYLGDGQQNGGVVIEGELTLEKLK